MPRGIPNSRQAKNNPVLPNAGIESAEQPIGYTTRDANPLGKTPQERIGTPKLVQVADRMPDAEWAANMAFLEEPVMVRIAQTNDKNADQVIELIVNGEIQLLRRGEPKTVKRKFVDLMARMKSTRFASHERTADNGEKYMEQVPYTATVHEFTVMKDANPLGEAWLKATLAMPG